MTEQQYRLPETQITLIAISLASIVLAALNVMVG